ncbi:MAG: hypothetical protein IKC71_00535 [Clostridia bacterium]|nr:hypothetical protein [Clostridia bacterium]
MKKNTNIINNVILFVVTVLAVLFVAFLGNKFFYGESLLVLILLFLAGMAFFAFVNLLCHEIGHIVAGKKNGFEFVSTRVLFITIVKENGKYRYYFSPLVDETGLAEMIPTHYDNIEERYKRTTRGGMIANAILVVLGAIPLGLIMFLPFEAYFILCALFPISIYSFLSNALPMIGSGVKNDALVISDLKKNTDSAKVLINILKIQAELYNGKTPSEIDESLYFDLPQLPEDDINYIVLLTNQYSYYLDKKEYVEAVKILKRLDGLIDYLPGSYKNSILAEELFVSCNIKRNEDLADDLMDTLEKFLYKENNLTNLRIKIAYLIYILEEKEEAKRFIEKAEKEIKTLKIKGLAKYEQKLIEEMKKDI